MESRNVIGRDREMAAGIRFYKNVLKSAESIVFLEIPLIYAQFLVF